ncbi:MAG: thioredoxin family protein [Chloroflexota bacterium]
MNTQRFFWIMMLLLLAACTRQQEVDEAMATLSPIQVLLVSTDFGVGQPRVSFAFFDGENVAQNVASVSLQVFPVDGGEAVWEGTAVSYTDYLIPYWVFYPELPTAGYWGVKTELTLTDGTTYSPGFVMETLAKTNAPALGAVAPPSENKTVFTESDLSKLSSGTDVNPALYQMTVAEAVKTGRPTVVGFVTPGLCQTRWCGPTLESVEAVQEAVGDEAANFIHIEVYDDFQALTLSAPMVEWGLATEPWVFVLDKDGRIVSRLSGPLSPTELQEQLAPLLSSGVG